MVDPLLTMSALPQKRTSELSRLLIVAAVALIFWITDDKRIAANIVAQSM